MRRVGLLLLGVRRPLPPAATVLQLRACSSAPPSITSVVKRASGLRFSDSTRVESSRVYLDVEPAKENTRISESDTTVLYPFPYPASYLDRLDANVGCRSSRLTNLVDRR